MYLLLF